MPTAKPASTRLHSVKWLTVLAIAVVCGGVAVVPAVLANRDGALPGHSGGPEGSGLNCVYCHEFNAGNGGVEILGMPRRFRRAAYYDLTVRVTDPAQAGAGFELSAEGETIGHQGTLLLTDTARTRFADAAERYVTHTFDGVTDSILNWAANGGSYEYHLQWRAPFGDIGRVNFYASGNAINNGTAHLNDNYHFAYATSAYAVPGDADGDTDLDLRDFAAMQRCFDPGQPAADECAYLDANVDEAIGPFDAKAFVLAMDGPVATQPTGLVLADAVRGGLMYDTWWTAAGLPTPTGDHPLWATRPDQTSNTRTGAVTWRCKECHGWDYKGVDGAYGTGSHRTGFPGIFGTTMSAADLYDLLAYDNATVAREEPNTGGMPKPEWSAPAEDSGTGMSLESRSAWRRPRGAGLAMPPAYNRQSTIDNRQSAAVTNGHGYLAAGLSEQDIWDLVAFVLSGQVDTDEFIDLDDPNGPFIGNAGLGFGHFQNTCTYCHGNDGTDLNFGTPESPSYVGTVANENPWEFLHKVRFGHPGSPMPPGEKLRWTPDDSADVGAYSQTLPTE